MPQGSALTAFVGPEKSGQAREQRVVWTVERPIALFRGAV